MQQTVRGGRLGVVVITLACATQPTTPREVENVAAFARLYGVARFFYPSDVAAELDWNRFAVHGVTRAREARDADALAETLLDLFAPLGPGFRVARELPPSPPPAEDAGPQVAWQYLGPGFEGGVGPYQARRVNRLPEPVIDGFVTSMQVLLAEDLRGSQLRLRGRARVDATGPGWGALWLRVDRPNRQPGFFDNMSDRPIREPAWEVYSIEGPVAEDAVAVAFGVMASGAVVADFDSIVLETHGADGRWSPVPIEDAGFEAAADRSPWQRAGTSAHALVERPGGDAPEGRQVLRLAAPQADAMPPPLLEDVAPRAGAHVDLDLAAGLRARVPIALSDGEARTRSGEIALRALRSALATPPDPAALDTRLADVVVAWNVFRHFYPYWDEVGVDWDAELAGLVARGSGPSESHLSTVRVLVARARDGHGRVISSTQAQTGVLPLSLRLVEGQVVVTGSAAPELAPVGAVVRMVDGEAAPAIVERNVALASGTEPWRRVRALVDLLTGPSESEVDVTLEDTAGVRTVRLAYGQRGGAPEPRPEPIDDLGDGILYVDLTRTSMADLTPELPRLAAAQGLVFDVRGYPTDSGASILPHLIDAPEDTRWMHVARIAAPFGAVTGWDHLGWDLQPAEPHLGAPRVFLTDERAISYAESVMGYVSDLGLGRVVGATTAGTNGNVKTFSLPSGLSVMFTGMRVTGHDGRSPHHLVGIRPEVPVEPTLEGIRAGRDEVLERALALLREAG